MPVHNRENFLPRAIESVLGQTYKNWELIIIDDSSTDESLKIIKEYAIKEKKIKLIRHKENWGAARLKDTYNQALFSSKGEIIAILEDDDFWPKNKLSIQVKDFQQKDIVLSFGDCIIVDEQGSPFTILSYKKHIKSFYSTNRLKRLSYFFDIVGYIIPVATLMRKKTLMSLGGFVSDSIYPFPDIPTFLALSLQGNFSYNTKILGYYRKHRHSHWYKFAKQTDAMSRDEVEECFKNFCNQNRAILDKNGYKLTSNLFKSRQEYLANKRVNKKRSIIIHELLFQETKMFRKTSRSIVNDKGEKNTTRLFALILSNELISQKLIIKAIFIAQYILYKMNISFVRNRLKLLTTVK